MTLLGGVTVYDGVMALIVFFATVHGFWKGATWQIAPIMSLVLGYMIAMPMSVTTAHYFGDPPQNRLFALVTIYIGVSLVVYLMVRSFRAGIDKANLTEFDRHIGAMLGFVKGVLLTLAITVILLIYSVNARELILKSESSTIAAKIINAVYPILPQALHSILRPYLQQLNGELPLDLHDSDMDGTLNPKSLPDGSGGSSLTPTTSSSARRRFSDDQYVPAPPRQRAALPNDDDDYNSPPSRPQRYRSAQYDDQDYQDNRQYDSATRPTSRSFAGDRGYQSDRPYSNDRSYSRDAAYSTDRPYSGDRSYPNDRSHSNNRAYTTDRQYQDRSYSDPGYPNDRGYSTDRTYSNDRRYTTERAYPENGPRPSLVPTPAEDDDPFHSGNADRASAPRR